MTPEEYHQARGALLDLHIRGLVSYSRVMELDNEWSSQLQKSTTAEFAIPSFATGVDFEKADSPNAIAPNGSIAKKWEKCLQNLSISKAFDAYNAQLPPSQLTADSLNAVAHSEPMAKKWEEFMPMKDHVAGYTPVVSNGDIKQGQMITTSQINAYFDVEQATANAVHKSFMAAMNAAPPTEKYVEVTRKPRKNSRQVLYNTEK